MLRRRLHGTLLILNGSLRMLNGSEGSLGEGSWGTQSADTVKRNQGEERRH